MAFDLPRPEKTTIHILDMPGRVVTRLVDQQLDSGSDQVRFDGSGLSSGVYLYRLVAGEDLFSSLAVVVVLSFFTLAILSTIISILSTLESISVVSAISVIDPTEFGTLTFETPVVEMVLNVETVDRNRMCVIGIARR